MKLSWLSILYGAIDILIHYGLILTGEVRLSLVDHGNRLCIWIGADQIVNGKRVKMAPLCNPMTFKRIEGNAIVWDGDVGRAFDCAAQDLFSQLKVALRAHKQLDGEDKPTWGHNYQLPKSTK